MTLWFTNGWLRRGSKKRAQSEDAATVDKENENDRPYPTMKRAKKKEALPFEGAIPADTGSWLLMQDQEGRMYWLNDVTGQWTYQLYSSPQQQEQQEYLQQHHHHLQQQQQQQQQQQHMMAPMQQVSYSQQHTAHLTHHHYNPNSLGLRSSPPLGPVSSPHLWPQHQHQHQHQTWGLLSPSAHTAAAAGLPAAAAVGGFGLGWGLSSDDGEEEEDEEAWAAEKKAGGTWDKFFDGRGLPVWIHSKTGSRSSVNPATTA